MQVSGSPEAVPVAAERKGERRERRLLVGTRGSRGSERVEGWTVAAEKKEQGRVNGCRVNGFG